MLVLRGAVIFKSLMNYYELIIVIILIDCLLTRVQSYIIIQVIFIIYLFHFIIYFNNLLNSSAQNIKARQSSITYSNFFS